MFGSKGHKICVEKNLHIFSKKKKKVKTENSEPQECFNVVPSRLISG